MGRYNFKNYEYSRKNNLNSDLNINKLARELVNKPARSSYRKNDAYKVGVVLYFMNGQTYKTPEFTVDDIYDALQQNKRWLDQENGGAINLGYVVRYSPYKFYEVSRNDRA
ncbi:hypothetical protein [Lactobacillus gasseri]|jgi:hypothetical protein|uniref:hypothetical protein n=2 Tax=Lactobacillus gasseri TaxID=1596 RepID=UPI00204AB77B|nr:hypothetical protein [Lactobacillus gasseri]MDX5065793.1 hypothetical protein [Lactobacillus gasseri]MDX5082494.1 hypothetical protein [Lactobacillus gasseri]DAV22942.1 MAG TPA: hypothetical protein [Caudoviricetes sp.]